MISPELIEKVADYVIDLSKYIITAVAFSAIFERFLKPETGMKTFTIVLTISIHAAMLFLLTGVYLITLIY
jgi:hypothetical protein